QPAQLAASHAKAGGEIVDRAFVEGAAVDQADGSRDGGGRPVPRRGPRGSVGAAAAARAEARLLGRGSAGEEAHVLPQRRARRADGAAIDAGGLHGGEEPPVEAG